MGWARGDGLIFDLFRGKTVHTTELLESPLDKKNHILIKEFSHIYLGVLNYYDIIISKLFRGTTIDMDDCISLIKGKRDEIDLKRLEDRFRETASYDVSEDKVNPVRDKTPQASDGCLRQPISNGVNTNLDNFLKTLKREGL